MPYFLLHGLIKMFDFKKKKKDFYCIPLYLNLNRTYLIFLSVTSKKTLAAFFEQKKGYLLKLFTV